MHRLPAVLLVMIALAASSDAQMLDSLMTWRTYSGEAEARVHVYLSNDLNRPVTVVVDESASNRHGMATDDARYLADVIGREIGHDPVEITFIFRISASSFCECPAGNKMLLLRATFTRTRAGNLATPNWRVLTRDELAELTDRQLY